MELLEDVGRENVELLSGEQLSQTRSLAQSERNDVRMLHEVAVIIEKALRSELLRIAPRFRVVVHSEQVEDVGGVVGDDVTCELVAFTLGGSVRKSNGKNSADSLHLPNHSVQVSLRTIWLLEGYLKYPPSMPSTHTCLSEVRTSTSTFLKYGKYDFTSPSILQVSVKDA